MEARDSKKMDGSDLKEVNGGYIFDTKEICEFPIKDRRWEIIDSKGDVVDAAPYLTQAFKRAEERGENIHVLNWEQLQKLRETGNPY